MSFYHVYQANCSRQQGVADEGEARLVKPSEQGPQMKCLPLVLPYVCVWVLSCRREAAPAPAPAPRTGRAILAGLGCGNSTIVFALGRTCQRGMSSPVGEVQYVSTVRVYEALGRTSDHHTGSSAIVRFSSPSLPVSRLLLFNNPLLHGIYCTRSSLE